MSKIQFLSSNAVVKVGKSLYLMAFKKADPTHFLNLSPTQSQLNSLLKSHMDIPPECFLCPSTTRKYLSLLISHSFPRFLFKSCLFFCLFILNLHRFLLHLGVMPGFVSLFTYSQILFFQIDCECSENRNDVYFYMPHTWNVINILFIPPKSS